MSSTHSPIKEKEKLKFLKICFLICLAAGALNYTATLVLNMIELPSNQWIKALQLTFQENPVGFIADLVLFLLCLFTFFKLDYALKKIAKQESHENN